MKKLFPLMLFFALLSMTTTSLTAQKDWTYMVYIIGSDLESDGGAATSDIQEMLAAGSTNNVNIAITTGGSKKDGWGEIKRWEVKDGQQMPIEYSTSNNNMADPANVTDFINWASSTYPADKYALVFWNHGSGYQGYGNDDNSGMNLKVPKIKSALQNSSFISSGKKFEALGFDACLMASLEVHSTIHPFANHLIASEQLEPGNGWNYTPIIQALENKTATDGAQLGKVTVDGFLAQCRSVGSNQVTLSVIDASKVEGIIQAVEGMLSEVGEAGIPDLQKARAKSEEYSSTYPADKALNNVDAVDILNLAENLKQTNSKYTAVADAVINAMKSAVSYNEHDDQQPHANGLTMFLPYELFKGQGAVTTIVDEEYRPPEFSSTIKNFVINYSQKAAGGGSDTPPEGEMGDEDGDYDDFEGAGLIANETAESRNPEEKIVSRIIVDAPEDIAAVRVLLIEQNVLETSDEFVTLGTVLPDAIKYAADGRMLVEYEWDQEWLGIGGYPVNIQSIKVTSSSANTFLAAGNLNANSNDERNPVYTSLTIPAVLNPDATFFGTDVHLNYTMTDDGYDLTSIIPQIEPGETNHGQKERISLKPGDRVMLLYDGFDHVKNETFDVVDTEAVFSIENGNDDLNLEHILLPLGAEFQIAFELIDFAQQNTIIYDSRDFVTSEIMLGNVATTTGATTMNVCTEDGISDIITFELADCNTDNITYVLTTDQDIILGAISPKIEFEGAPVYNFRVYGLAYSGNLTVNYGDNILSDDLADGDFTLTDNFVAVNVLEAGACSNLQGNLDQNSRTYFDASESYLQPTLELATDLEDKPMILADLLKHRKIVLAPNTTSVYPNPVSTFVNLDLGQYEGKQGHISIINTLGQVTKQLAISEIAKRPISIDVQSFNTGIYLIQINVNGALIDTHKFIKNGMER